MEFSRESLRMGLKNQEASEETPESFATMSGADSVSTEKDLATGRRMAGPVGAFALKLMNDPATQSAVNGWMSRFNTSNEGAQFNQAKMGGVPPEKE